MAHDDLAVQPGAERERGTKRERERERERRHLQEQHRGKALELGGSGLQTNDGRQAFWQLLLGHHLLR